MVVDAARETTYRIAQSLHMSIGTSLYAVSDDLLNRPAADCHLPPCEEPSGQLSVTRDATVPCIKDGRMTNAHFTLQCVRYS